MNTITWAAVWTFLACSQCLAHAESAKGGKVVRAERFELTDSQGKTRAILGMKRGEPEIVFLDRKGNTRFHVSLAKDGSPYLSLRGDRAGLEISSEKGGKFFDVVISSSKAKGSPVMFMGDDAAGAQVVLGLASGQVPVLYLVNEGQRHAGPSQTEVALGASGPAHGGGHIYVGAPKSQAVKDKTGQSAITVFDTNGKLLWQSPR